MPIRSEKNGKWGGGSVRMYGKAGKHTHIPQHMQIHMRLYNLWGRRVRPVVVVGGQGGSKRAEREECEEREFHF